MTKNIYLVTSGSYSDYGIRGAFSSAEIAQSTIDKAKIAEQHWASDAGIEEYEIDTMTEFEPVSSWCVGIDLKTGELKGAYRIGDPDMESSITFEKTFRSDTSEKTLSFDGRMRKRVRSTVSFEHACELAVEWRQGYLRESILGGK